ncbi:MAG: cobyrinate a,c-diamide synthase [Wujia sp.]
MSQNDKPKLNNTSSARFVLAAVKSGSGKTTVTCGLIQAFQNRGLRVSSVKCGPDYIDPMFHRRVLGVSTGNLDTFFTDEATTRAILRRRTQDADITILEGVMGYYDGLGGVSDRASTYELAGITGSPVILVVDAKGISVTLSALIKGIIDYREDSHIAGIILNRVSESYYLRLKQLLEENCGVPVVGFLPEISDINVPSRHLGLIAPEEIESFNAWKNTLADAIEKYIDLDSLLGIAATAKPLTEDVDVACRKLPSLKNKIRIAVARDEAFSFYYSENMELLQLLGAELVYFSPLRDRKLPENVQCLLLGGGYPEIYAGQLSENRGMLESIRRAYEDGIKVIAECGGFMYLMKELCDDKDISHPMVGILEGRAYNTGRLCRFGYIELTANINGEPVTIRGHEFHRWDTSCNGTGLIARKPITGDEYACMHLTDRLLAGFPHLSYFSNVEFIYKLFVDIWKLD